SWTALNAATYWVEAYYSGASPFPGEEYWGSVQPTVVAGTTTTTSLNRTEPYAKLVEFRVGSSSGALLGSSSTIAPGQTIWVGVKVLQSTGAPRSAKNRVILDRAQDTSYDLDTADSVEQTVPSGTTGFTFTFNVTPTQIGAYYYATQVTTLLNNKYTKTDGWA